MSWVFRSLLDRLILEDLFARAFPCTSSKADTVLGRPRCEVLSATAPAAPAAATPAFLTTEEQAEEVIVGAEGGATITATARAELVPGRSLRSRCN